MIYARRNLTGKVLYIKKNYFFTNVTIFMFNIGRFKRLNKINPYFYHESVKIYGKPAFRRFKTVYYFNANDHGGRSGIVFTKWCVNVNLPGAIDCNKC